MVKISIIVPIHNEEKYLRQCLDSIVNQTFRDFEIICINDGSTDSTQEILEEYSKKDARIKVLNRKHMGLGGVRNVGLDVACGEYIYFTDSDDYLESNTLETIYSITCERNLDLLIFKLANFTDEGEWNYDYSNMPFLEKFGDDVFSYEDILDHILEIDVTVYTKFYRKDLISDTRFEERMIFEDNLFFTDVFFKAKRISFYNECLYNRRIHEDSITKSSTRQHTDILRVFNMMNDKFRKLGYYPQFKEKLFMRKVDGVNYRYDLIAPEYKEYLFSEIKKDYVSKKEMYEKELDFSKIDLRSKTIFESVLSSNSAREFEIQLNAATLENRFNYHKNRNKKLKDENESLKSVNKSIINSKSWKITKPLRIIRNLK